MDVIELRLWGGRLKGGVVQGLKANLVAQGVVVLLSADHTPAVTAGKTGAEENTE